MILSISNHASAQSQVDLDAISKRCSLPVGRLVLKDEHILLFASPDDNFMAMGCVRAEIDKIPGATDKLGVVMWEKNKAKAKAK
ncbi:hypothetical protein [Sphingomonas beigongshangi]|uniref:hypothetical protein n=1 Tax=Sphingomonas beigongshangi TaxID=2782540 RepID=UPI00193BA331|nr:hypothetical protein [Sphingomonas beigongshangi]